MKRIIRLKVFGKILESKQSKINGLQIFLKESASITKLDILINGMDAFGIVPTFSVNQKITEFNRLVDTIKSNTSVGDNASG